MTDAICWKLTSMDKYVRGRDRSVRLKHFLLPDCVWVCAAVCLESLFGKCKS